MIPSEFLQYCAVCFCEGWLIEPLDQPGWTDYLRLTYPQHMEDWNEREIVETRVMRFLLASEIAKGEGH